MSYYNKDVSVVLDGTPCPKAATEDPNATAADKGNTAIYDLLSLLFVTTAGFANILVRQFESKKHGKGLRDRTAAWLALAETYDIQTKAARCFFRRELDTSTMQQGEDLEDSFSKMEDLRTRMKERHRNGGLGRAVRGYDTGRHHRWLRIRPAKQLPRPRLRTEGNHEGNEEEHVYRQLVSLIHQAGRT